MNRTAIVAVVIAAATVSALADDITIDTTPFVSTATRAEVQAELKAFKQSRVNPWSMQYNPLAHFTSKRTRAEVVAEFMDARDSVAAFNSEDSGSAYLARRDSDASASTRVAGRPRNSR